MVSQLLDIIGQWYWLPLLVVYLSVILTILIENRNPSKTIAWVLVIVFVPIFGVVIYYLFGQKFNKIKLFQKENESKHRHLLSKWKDLQPYLSANLEKIEKSHGGLSRVFSFLWNQRVSPPILGNEVQVLINGEQKYPAVFEAIERAKHHIHLEYYIFEDDLVGSALLELLHKKALQGVKVRIILDAFGSPKLARRIKRLKDLNLETVVFLPVRLSSLANSNYRNHRKLIIIDGLTAFVGGINISDYYCNDFSWLGRIDKGSTGENIEPSTGASTATNTVQNKWFWRDTSIRVEGGAVNVLQTYFWLDWLFAGGAEFELMDGYLQTKPLRDSDGAAVSFANSDPGSPAPYCMEALLVAIAEAQECIRLCTPYFIPSDQLSTALQVAAASGIRVELIIPQQGDSYIVQHASMSFLKPLLQRGVHVYLYQKGFMHAKTVTIDQKLAFIGTVNLDIRSFYINFETACVIADDTISLALDKQFELDKLDSQYITLEEWKSREAWKRGLDSLCRLLTPLL